MAAGEQFFTPNITVEISDSDEESEEDWVSSDSEIETLKGSEEVKKNKIRNKKEQNQERKLLKREHKKEKKENYIKRKEKN